MTDYTPTDAEVRDGYAAWEKWSNGEPPFWNYEEFDRWLAAHDAAISARIFDALFREGAVEVVAKHLFRRSVERLDRGFPPDWIAWENTDRESWREDARAVSAALREHLGGES